MDIQQKQIDELVHYSNSLLKDRQDISGEDIVYEIILTYLEKGQQLPTDIKSIIQKRTLAIKNREQRSLNNLTTTFGENQTTKFCSGCKDDLPVAMFYLLRNQKQNTESLSHLCKTCQSKYYKEKRKNVEYKKDRNKKDLQYYHSKIKLKKEFEKKAYLKQAHSLLEWRKSA